MTIFLIGRKTTLICEEEDATLHVLHAYRMHWEPGLLYFVSSRLGGIEENTVQRGIPTVHPFSFRENDVTRCFLNALPTTRNMPLSMVEVQRVMAVLADEDQLKVTVKSSAYGGVVAGVTTTVGGLLAGPPGLLIGGAVGGLLAYKSAGNFRPVSQIINDMNAHERQLLYDTIKDIIDNLHIDDYLALIAFLSGGPGLLVRQQLMDRMVSFLRDQMRLQMAN